MSKRLAGRESPFLLQATCSSCAHACTGSVFSLKTRRTLADVSFRLAGRWLFGTLWKLAAAVTTVRMRGTVVSIAASRGNVSLSWGRTAHGLRRNKRASNKGSSALTTSPTPPAFPPPPPRPYRKCQCCFLQEAPQDTATPFICIRITPSPLPCSLWLIPLVGIPTILPFIEVVCLGVAGADPRKIRSVSGGKIFCGH